MVARRTAINWIAALLNDLKAVGYDPKQVVLFGSVANGNQHEHSDVDVAIWDERFTGCKTFDYEAIKRILTKYTLLELHTFHTSDTPETNPWAGEILRTGIKLDLATLLTEQAKTAVLN